MSKPPTEPGLVPGFYCCHTARYFITVSVIQINNYFSNHASVRSNGWKTETVFQCCSVHPDMLQKHTFFRFGGNMKILFILCTSLLLTFANTSFAQPMEEEELQASPRMPGEDTRMKHRGFSTKEAARTKSPATMVAPAVQPGMSSGKAGVIGDIGVQGRASSGRPAPQPGVTAMPGQPRIPPPPPPD